MLKSFGKFINENDTSSVEGEAFEAALMDHLKEVVGISNINIGHLRGRGLSVYELSVHLNLRDEDGIDVQINRFKDIKELVEELFTVKKDFMNRSNKINAEIAIKFHMELEEVENSNFYRSVKGIDKYSL